VFKDGVSFLLTWSKQTRHRFVNNMIKGICSGLTVWLWIW